jgi:hypothetical protein
LPGEFNGAFAVAGHEEMVFILEHDAQRLARAFFIIHDQESPLLRQSWGGSKFFYGVRVHGRLRLFRIHCRACTGASRMYSQETEEKTSIIAGASGPFAGSFFLWLEVVEVKG